MTDDSAPMENPLPDELIIQCVNCFEWVSISVDPHDRGAMIQDCDVCCSPLLITVKWAANGQPELRIESGN